MKPVFAVGLFEMMIVLKWKFCIYFNLLND